MKAVRYNPYTKTTSVITLDPNNYWDKIKQSLCFKPVGLVVQRMDVVKMDVFGNDFDLYVDDDGKIQSISKIAVSEFVIKQDWIAGPFVITKKGGLTKDEIEVIKYRLQYVVSNTFEK